MKRKGAIFLITHGYPLWIVIHMVFGRWSRINQIVFNIVPLITFGSLFVLWENTSHLRLDSCEKRCLSYLVLMLFVITLYYCICIDKDAWWCRSHNLQFSAFVLVTLGFYIYSYYETKPNL